MSDYTQALSYAAAFCSASEHCTSEVLEKLKRFELTPEEVHQVLTRLRVEGFLDERRYVKAFVNDKFRFSKWGKVKIAFMLRQKGIQISMDDSLNQIPEEDYLETLTELLKQKRRSVKAKSTYELRGKLFRFAAGRGFEPTVIQTCLSKIGIDEE